MKPSRTYPLLLPPVVAQLIVEAASGGGPLRCQPAHASLHEAQRLLPRAHLLHQGPDVKLENSLWATGRNDMISFSSPSTDIPLDFFKHCKMSRSIRHQRNDLQLQARGIPSCTLYNTLSRFDMDIGPKILNIQLYRTSSKSSNINALMQSVYSAPAFLPCTNT